MTDVTLATPDDLPALLDMIRDLSTFHGDTAQVTAAQLNTIFFAPHPVATALIAKSNGDAVGYAGLTPTTVIHDGKLRLDIHHLIVPAPHRGTGIGKSLIQAAKTHALKIGANRLTIGTDASNATAIAAYRAMAMLEEITGTGPRFRVDLTS